MQAAEPTARAFCSRLEPWNSAGKRIEQASCPPSSWYTSAHVAALEQRSVFRPTWQYVTHIGNLQNPGDFVTAAVAGAPVLMCVDDNGQLRAFHNVCRHHAAAVASGCGSAQQFECPYHGWTYALDGRLRKATRLKGIEGFRAADNGLVPMLVDTWGHLVFVRISEQAGVEATLGGYLGAGGAAAEECGLTDSLQHVGSREWHLNCNWKVFCDNYLDGGYHVPFAHESLAAGLQLRDYQSALYERISIQSVLPALDADARLSVAIDDRPGGGRAPAYVFLFPNLMINRYGPWMDTNAVHPTSPTTCTVRFDWWLDPQLAGRRDTVQQGIDASAAVQEEDVTLCEAVQRGLASPAYSGGRYAPSVETPMWHFHQLLNARLERAEQTSAEPTLTLESRAGTRT